MLQQAITNILISDEKIKTLTKKKKKRRYKEVVEILELKKMQESI